MADLRQRDQLYIFSCLLFELGIALAYLVGYGCVSGSMNQLLFSRNLLLSG